jgi:hypothetical protein
MFAQKNTSDTKISKRNVKWEHGREENMFTHFFFSFLFLPGVNLNKNLSTAFTYVSCAHSFFVLTF